MKTQITPKKKKIKATIPDNLVGIKFINPLDLNQSGESSVEIKRNSKGGVEFRVKIYENSSAKAMKEAVATFEILKKKYKI